MRRFASLAVLGVLALAAFAPARVIAAEIEVTFTNRTPRTVTFFLNGGPGLETRLKAGQSLTYTMAVDQGVGPSVTIYQPNGSKLPFGVENGGVYAFRFADGRIKNFYDE